MIYTIKFIYQVIIGSPNKSETAIPMASAGPKANKVSLPCFLTVNI
jgi:hypothetical protein